MFLLYKFLYSVIIIVQVNSKSKSWDKKCTNKFPDCTLEGITYTNTACDTQNCNPKFKTCIELPPDAKFRQAMLDVHNELRNKVASGSETGGGMSAAANMRALSYDLGLEFTAICHVHGCLLEHDKCRGTTTFQYAGQNLALVENTQNLEVEQKHVDSILTIETLKGMVTDWYEEIKLDDFKDLIDNFSKFNHDTGHFTALIWGTVTHVGCGKAIDRSKEYEFTIYLTCNYGPSGNVFNFPMFTKGTGCSKCPAGVSCNTKYTSLCGNIDPKDVIAGENPYRAKDRTGRANNLVNSGITLFVLQLFLLFFHKEKI